MLRDLLYAWALFSCSRGERTGAQRSEQRNEIRWPFAVDVDSVRLTFVLHPPLELHDHHLPREVVQEGLRVDRDRRLLDFKIGVGVGKKKERLSV